MPEMISPELLQNVRRITLIWIGRLGDFLITTPFLHALRVRFPHAEITLVVGEKGREVAALCPDVDRILVLRKITAPFANLRLAAELALHPADLLIDLNSAYSRASMALCALARAKTKLSFEKNKGNRVYSSRIAKAGETEQMLDRYGRLAAALGADYDPTLRLRVPQDLVTKARELLRGLGFGDDSPSKIGVISSADPAPASASTTSSAPSSASTFDQVSPAGSIARPSDILIAVHPGNFKKFDNRWPEEKFAALTNRLLGYGGVRVVYLSGPGEEREVANIVARLKFPVPVLPSLPVATSAAVLSLVDLLIVNATGTAHLAAAVGTPTFSFLGKYTKTVWMPRRGPHHSVVSDSWESCRDISVDTAWTALMETLKTLPRRSSAR